jgi:hypothetical protein
MLISKNAIAHPSFPDAQARDLLRRRQRVLILDCPDSAMHLTGTLSGPVYAQWRFLGANMLANVRPDAILAPLISRGWDIVDLGAHLHGLRWTGDVFALTLPLPRAELVLRETRAVCPGLSLHLIALP